MKALMYHSNHNRRFAAALGAAAMIHLAAIGFANTRQETPPIVSGPTGEQVLELFLRGPTPEPSPDQSEPLPTPPPMTDQSFPEQISTPPPVRRPTSKLVAPILKTRGTGSAASMTISSARVFAINAPRPEYPYEARRQKITGDGVVAMTVDPVSGQVTDVSIVKSTGSPFLDNAALTGFRRWRFKPGTVGSVRCPITFTLVGASY
jgi:TonB family protein